MVLLQKEVENCNTVAQQTTTLLEILPRLNAVILNSLDLSVEDLQMRVVFLQNIHSLVSNEFSEPDRSFLQCLEKLITDGKEFIQSVLKNSIRSLQDRLWPLYERILSLPELRVDFFSYSLSRLKEILHFVDQQEEGAGGGGEEEEFTDSLELLLGSANMQHPIILSILPTEQAEAKIRRMIEVLAVFSQQVEKLPNNSHKKRLQILDHLKILLDCYDASLSRLSKANDKETKMCEATLTGIGLGFFLINQRMARAIASLSKEGKEVKSNRSGNRSVSEINGIFFKLNPDKTMSVYDEIHPELEDTVSAVYRLLQQPSAISSTLLIKIDNIFVEEQKFQSKFVQASLGIKGISLGDYLDIIQVIRMVQENGSKREFYSLLKETYVGVFVERYPEAIEITKDTKAYQFLPLVSKFLNDIGRSRGIHGLHNLSDSQAAKMLKNLSGFQLLKTFALIFRFPNLFDIQTMNYYINFLQTMETIRNLFPKLEAAEIFEQLTVINQKCNLENFGTHILASILTNPGDHHGENLKVEMETDKDGRIESWQIVGIDNDEVFRAPIHRSHYIGVKTVLYLMEQMETPLKPHLKEIFLKSSPLQLCTNLLSTLEKQNRLYVKLVGPKNQINSLQVPLCLRPEVLLVIFEKARAITNLLLEVGDNEEELSLQQLLTGIQPLVSAQYFLASKALPFNEKEAFISYIHKSLQMDKEILNISPITRDYSEEEVAKQSLLECTELLIKNYVNIDLLSPQEKVDLFGLIHESFPQLSATLRLTFSTADEERLFFFRAVDLRYNELVKDILFNDSKNSKRKFVRMRNNEEMTGFLLAAAKLDASLIRIFLHHLSPDEIRATNAHGETALHLIVKQFRPFPRQARFIFFSFLDHLTPLVNESDKDGKVPLYHALKNYPTNPSFSKEIIRALIEHGADCNKEVRFNRKPLDIAVEINDETLVEFLLSLNAVESTRKSRVFSFYQQHPNFDKLLSRKELDARMTQGVVALSPFIHFCQQKGSKSSEFRLDFLKNSFEVSHSAWNLLMSDRSVEQKLSFYQPLFQGPGGFYVRLFSLFPTIDFAAYSFFSLLIGGGILKSDLVRLSSSTETLPALVYPEISGFSLFDVLSDQELSWILYGVDPGSFSCFALTSLLVNFDDGRPENFVLRKSQSSFHIYCINPEKAFTEDDLSQEVHGKSIIFCLNQMRLPISKKVKRKFLSLNIEEKLHRWLVDLEEREDILFKMFEKDLSRLTDRQIFVVAPFPSTLMCILKRRFKSIKDCLQKQRNPSCLDVLCHTFPLVGPLYRAAFESSHHPLERFARVSAMQRSDNGFSDTFNLKRFLDVQKLSVHALQSSKCIYPARKMTNELIRSTVKEQSPSKLLKNPDFSKLCESEKQRLLESFPEETQKVMLSSPRKFLKCLDNNRVEELTLQRYNLVDDKMMKRLIFKFEKLVALSISSMELLTASFFDILPKLCPTLHRLSLRALHINKISIESSSLNDLQISSCTNLTALSIVAPSLKELQLDSCDSLAQFSVLPKSLRLNYYRQDNCEKLNIWPNLVDRRFSRKKFLELHHVRLHPEESWGTLQDFFSKNMREVPRELKSRDQLFALKNLELKRMKITIVDPELGSLVNLKKLSLSENRINSLPKELFSLVSLKKLDLSFNNLEKDFTSNIQYLSRLESLNLASNAIEFIPAEIASLSNLTEFILCYNQIKCIPAEIAQLRNLRLLDLTFNRVHCVPYEVSLMHKIEIIKLGDNCIYTMPSAIGFLKILSELELFSNNLKSISFLGPRLVSLKKLSLAMNTISQIPEDIKFLVDLEELNLKKNQISVLPPEIKQLKFLRILNLSENPLKSDFKNKKHPFYDGIDSVLI